MLRKLDQEISSCLACVGRNSFRGCQAELKRKDYELEQLREELEVARFQSQNVPWQQFSEVLRQISWVLHDFHDISRSMTRL